mmetsp:Transcript_15260/g.40515  ORF Transcript_15260/g.40515 Transcript_15260/m.40515 type:complete len:284 (+) Transcript_15260:176-1027(+)
MISLALAIAASSSARLLVSCSNSSALLMQSWWRSASAVMSPLRSLVVMPRSPSAAAFFSPDAAMLPFASDISLLPNLISSCRDCCIISKACRSAVSLSRASESCACAFSSMSWSTSTMPPLWPSYVAAAGAPGSASSDRCWVCTRAASFEASPVSIMLAETITERASARLLALWICIMDAPCFFISRSRMPTARSMVSAISMSSFSEAAKASPSFARISVAAFRSCSSTLISPLSFSISTVREPMSASSSVMVAESSFTSALPVLISKEISLERSSHHSANSS